MNPFVSSSKNRNRPALEAGSGAPFFFLLALTAGAASGPVKNPLGRPVPESARRAMPWGRTPRRPSHGAGRRAAEPHPARRGQSAAGGGRAPPPHPGWPPRNPRGPACAGGGRRAGTRRRLRYAVLACRRSRRGPPLRPARPSINAVVSAAITTSLLNKKCLLAPPRRRRRGRGGRRRGRGKGVRGGRTENAGWYVHRRIHKDMAAAHAAGSRQDDPQADTNDHG